MGIRAKILASFLLLAVAAGLASGVSLYMLAKGRAALEAETERIDRYAGQAQRANQVVGHIYERIFASLFKPGEELSELRSRLDADSVEFYKLMDELDELSPTRSAHHATYREAFVSFYVFASRMIEQRDLKSLSDNPQVLEHFQLRQKLLSDELVETLAGLREDSRKNLAMMGEVADSMSRLSIAVALATVLVAALTGLMLSRGFAKPMTRLLEWVESTGGEVTQSPGELPQFGADEVGRLARAFSELKTRLAAKERELMRRNLESVGRLAGGVAHEYNNLLNAISACLHPLKSGAAQSAQAREEAERIALLCRRGGELSSQLLAVAGKAAGKLETVDASYFASQLETLLPRLVPEQVKVVVEAQKSLPSVKCSPALLLSALLNLVYNAVDALEGAGKIRLAITSEAGEDGGRSVVFLVADNGRGIPPSVLPLIFDPFYTTKETGRGTGLGLSIVHSFAENHGGSVSVTSSRGGTEFRLLLPALEVGVAGVEEAQSGAILTDRPENGALAAKALTDAGITPLLPREGENPLDALQRLNPKIGLVAIDTGLISIPPELAHKLIKRFFPGARVAFFGSDRQLANAIDPAADWLETASRTASPAEIPTGDYRTH